MSRMTTKTNVPSYDVELIRRVAVGDSAAFEEFHDRFKGLVRSVVQRTIGFGPDVEDVCQNAFLAIWKQAWRFDPTRSKPVTWISLVTRSIARDAFRALMRSPRCGLVDEMEVTGDARRVNPMEHDEMIEGAERALDSLPARYRTVVVLACLRGMTRRQIAQMQGIPVGTVKSSLRRGTEQMRIAMESAA